MAEWEWWGQGFSCVRDFPGMSLSGICQEGAKEMDRWKIFFLLRSQASEAGLGSHRVPKARAHPNPTPPLLLLLLSSPLVLFFPPFLGGRGEKFRGGEKFPGASSLPKRKAAPPWEEENGHVIDEDRGCGWKARVALLFLFASG